MAWRPRPSNRFYRLIVRLGLFLRWAFQIRILATGMEQLPPPGLRHGIARAVSPGSGAVFAITHFGYVDFAAAELVLWKHAHAQLRFMIHQGAADHWLAGPAISATNSVVVRYSERAGALDEAGGGRPTCPAAPPPKPSGNCWTPKTQRRAAVEVPARGDAPAPTDSQLAS